MIQQKKLINNRLKVIASKEMNDKKESPIKLKQNRITIKSQMEKDMLGQINIKLMTNYTRNNGIKHNQSVSNLK